MPVEITSKYTMCGDDLLLQAMDLPSTGLYFTDVDVSSNAIPINASHSWEVMDIIHEELKFEKLLSTSPNTFVLQTTFGTPPQNIPGAPTACSKLAESVRLRNHDCMWSGRCNSQESHAKSKLKSAAAAAAAAAAKMQATNGEVVTAVANKQTTSVPSPTKVRTIQAGESLLRFKQPMQKSHSNTSSNSSSGNSSSDENNNRPDTPQSLEGEDSSQDITCTTTGSNHLPLLSKDAAREHEVNKIKEYLADPAKQYKAYDNSTTLADVINTLESGDFKRDNQYPMSPSEDSDCRSSQMVDDDTESEREMDDEYYVQEDDEGISLKMMPTSHLNASRRELALSKMVARHIAVHDEDDEEEEDDDDEEEEDSDEDEETEEEEDESPVKGSKVFVGGNRSGNVVAYGDDEEDSGTERSLYGNSVTAQSKLAIQQQTSMHSDHCYTRCKARVDMKSLGVDTPSDSEEEIDVVGVGEKNLPTNPSAKDRKALQATVRNRFVRASAGGIVTAPPTGPNSGATTPGGRNPGYYAAMNNGSSYSSAAKISQLKKRQQQQFSKMDDMYYDEDLTENSNISLSSSGRKLSGAAMRSNSKGSSRKRSAASAAMGYAKSSKHYHESSKKSKYAGSVNSSMKSSSARPMQKGYGSANDYRNTVMTSFTLEKRNLHNDLERQRRIGLKNLFEELKCQIPSLRDKERAPKVSILREAAQLCTDLSREQDTLFALRRQRERLLQTARTLKLQLQRSANRNK